MYTIIKKIWRSGYWKSDTDQALPHDSFQILFVFVLFINGWFIQFQTLFWATECNSWANQTLPHAFDRGAMRPKYRWLFLLFQLRRLYNSCTDPLKNANGCRSYAIFSWVYKRSMFAKLYVSDKVTVMYQCVYGNLISIMLRIVYLVEPPEGIIYVYWNRSPTGDTYAIILFPMF